MERDIPWARIALHQSPEAINLWIGNSLSTTAMHKDNYENIYVQILGQKHFLLLPPLAHACLDEKELPPASYVRRDGSGFNVVREEGDKVPFVTWDVDMESEGGTKHSQLAIPIRVTLEKGDMLYLPTLWFASLSPSQDYHLIDLLRYHKVSQSCSTEGICCAVNYCK